MSKLRLAAILLSSVDTHLLCLDEPFANLDLYSVESFMNLIKYKDFKNKINLIVTHAWTNKSLAHLFTHVMHITKSGDIHYCSAECVNDELMNHLLFSNN